MLPLAVRCPDRGLMLVAFMITTPPVAGRSRQGRSVRGRRALLARAFWAVCDCAKAFCGPVCRGCGGRCGGRMAQEAEDFGVQPLGSMSGWLMPS